MKLYSITTAAKKIGVTRQYLNRLVLEGKVPRADVSADFTLIDSKEVEILAEQFKSKRKERA